MLEQSRILLTGGLQGFRLPVLGYAPWTIENPNLHCLFRDETMSPKVSVGVQLAIPPLRWWLA